MLLVIGVGLALLFFGQIYTGEIYLHSRSTPIADRRPVDRDSNPAAYWTIQSTLGLLTFLILAYDSKKTP